MLSKTFIKIILLGLLAHNILLASNIDSEELIDTQMPFKIGFEFQESHHLCPWAKFNSSIQKKPLFSVKDINLDRKLWEVVIDGEDIEFVLEPFSYTEYNVLKTAIDSLLEASKPITQTDYSTEDLKQALKNVQRFIDTRDFATKIGAYLRDGNRFNQLDCFEIWKEWLKSHSKYSEEINVETSEKWTDDDLLKLWNQAPIQGIKINDQQFLNMTKIRKAETITFDNWFNLLKKSLPTFGYDLDVDPLNYSNIKESRIMKCQALEFQPQATIQFPLEYSIPLFFNLFNFTVDSPVIINLVSSLPFLDNINEQNMEIYFTKKAGLVFLHALALSGITTQNNCINALHVIQERYVHTGQVDAKGTLNFMSRRPFSDMWKDIKDKNDDFWMIYNNGLRKNKIFAKNFFKSQTSNLIEWADDIFPNYAKQLTSTTGEEDLSKLEDYFTKNFLKECNSATNNPLLNLLRKGILTTGMINNFDDTKIEIKTLDGSYRTPQQIFKSYYEQAVQSVQHPSSRYVFDFDKMQIVEQEYAYDSLSPPLFLDQDDAMGFFKQYNSDAIKLFGEAIIEIRNIKQALSKDKNFLTAKNDVLLTNVKQLFDFLKGISKEKILSQNFMNDMLSCSTSKKED